MLSQDRFPQEIFEFFVNASIDDRGIAIERLSATCKSFRLLYMELMNQDMWKIRYGKFHFVGGLCGLEDDIKEYNINYDQLFKALYSCHIKINKFHCDYRRNAFVYSSAAVKTKLKETVRVIGLIYQEYGSMVRNSISNRDNDTLKFIISLCNYDKIKDSISSGIFEVMMCMEHNENTANIFHTLLSTYKEKYPFHMYYESILLSIEFRRYKVPVLFDHLDDNGKARLISNLFEQPHIFDTHSDKGNISRMEAIEDSNVEVLDKIRDKMTPQHMMLLLDCCCGVYPKVLRLILYDFDPSTISAYLFESINMNYTGIHEIRIKKKLDCIKVLLDYFRPGTLKEIIGDRTDVEPRIMELINYI